MAYRNQELVAAARMASLPLPQAREIINGAANSLLGDGRVRLTEMREYAASYIGHLFDHLDDLEEAAKEPTKVGASDTIVPIISLGEIMNWAVKRTMHSQTEPVLEDTVNDFYNNTVVKKAVFITDLHIGLLFDQQQFKL